MVRLLPSVRLRRYVVSIPTGLSGGAYSTKRSTADNMRDTQPQGRRETYRARFTGGPWDRRRARLAAPTSGRPQDFVEVSDASDGAYAVAGAADAEGYVPYWWVSWASVATAQATPTVRAVDPERERE